MEEQLCARARLALQQAFRTNQSVGPEPALSAHIAECEVCRGSMLLIMTELFGLPIASSETPCDRCLDDLPAFVEREMAGDPREAARAYPHVWLHLWTCAECAETYDLTRLLLVAEQRGKLTAFSPARLIRALSPRFLHLLRLTRQFLNQALPIQAPFAVARGEFEGPTALSEGDVGAGRYITLSVQEQPDRNWIIQVVVTPQIKGWLVLTLGERLLRARFDEQGVATVVNVPAALLTSSNGPDLEVGIDSDEDER